MIINSLNRSAFASAVWAATTRLLSSLGVGVIADFGNPSASVAAASNLDIVPPAGSFIDLSIYVLAGAAGSLQFRSEAGSSVILGVTVAAGQTTLQNIKGSSVSYTNLLNNDATNPAKVATQGFRWIQ